MSVTDSKFTMPAANVTVSAEFAELTPYTVFYNRADNSNIPVKCKLDGVEYDMVKNASLGNIQCWALLIPAADGKANFSLSFSTDGGSTWSSAVNKTPQTEIPSNLAAGDSDVIKGDTKALILALSKGTESISSKIDFYLVTGNTESITVTNPTREYYTFKGWEYIDSQRNVKTIDAGSSTTTIPVSGQIEVTTILSALWERNQCTVTFEADSATWSTQTVSSGQQTPKPDDPTKAGYAFAGWVVAKAATEKVNGKETRLAVGSSFDFSNTLIINDLTLKATWKHVHSYAYFQIDDPKYQSSLAAYQDYKAYVHVRACANCNSCTLEAHSYDSSGKCVCGAVKPPEPAVLATYIDGQLTSTTKTYKGVEVTIDAPEIKDDKSFVKWQYKSIDGGTTYDLTTDPYASFILPANLAVNAVYEKWTTPQIFLSAYPQGGNLVFSMKYTVPDDWTIADAYIISGNNYDLRYMDVNVFGPCDVRFAYKKGNAIDALGKDTLRNKMFSGEAVNISGYSDVTITRPSVLGKNGNANVAYSADAINRDNGEFYYYAMGCLLCKDAGGETRVVLTDPISATKNSPLNGTNTLSN